MDSIIYLAAVISVSVAIVLLFGATVLSVKWWRYGITTRIRNSNKNKAHSERALPRSQVYKKIDRLYNLNELINKKVYTCEAIYIGRIVAIDSHSFIVRNDRNQEYAISTYWIREYDQENAVIDTSVRYLDYYQVKSAETI